MPSLIFIHGTGGRQKAFAETLIQMEEAIQTQNLDAELIPCLWGDSLGAKLNAGGASIPAYEDAQGGQTLSSKDDELQLWEALYTDPFYEMRLLGLRSLQDDDDDLIPGELSPARQLKARVEALRASNDLKTELQRLGIYIVFDRACEIIAGPDSKLFERLQQTASNDLSDDYTAIARAIVSESRILCKEQEIYPWLLVNEKLRDEAVTAIQKTLSDEKTAMGGIGEWAKDLLIGAVAYFGTNKVKRKRGAIMDGAYPFAGDILVYQAKGKEIRQFIRSQILSEKVESPVVLLAHSLGGIACVDLLIEEDLSEKVAGLITVGSQAPFFYEIGALQTRAYGEPLPAHFPQKWLNIYDLRDFLSYIGDSEGIFPGKVEDVEVNNNQPFPEAHSAYWANEETWEAISEFLLCL